MPCNPSVFNPPCRIHFPIIQDTDIRRARRGPFILQWQSEAVRQLHRTTILPTQQQHMAHEEIHRRTMPKFDGHRRRPLSRRPLRPTVSDNLDYLRLLIPIQQRVRPAVYTFFSPPYELVPSPIFKHRFDVDTAGVRMRVMARGMLEVVEIDRREYLPVDHTRPQKSVR